MPSGLVGPVRIAQIHQGTELAQSQTAADPLGTLRIA